MKVIVYEINPEKETENVSLFGVCTKWQDTCIAELVIRQRKNTPFFIHVKNAELRKIKRKKAWFKVFEEKYAEMNDNE